MKTNVLVMCSGSMPGVAVINALRLQSEVPVRVVAADMSRLSAGGFIADHAVLVPPAGDQDFLPVVRDICARERIRVVFPIIDEELQVFADHAEEFSAEGVVVITNPPETVRIAKDKALTVRRCKELGIRVPMTWLPIDIADGAAPAYPVVVKPRDGRGSVGVVLAYDREELGFHLARAKNALVQEWIDGPEYTVDVLSDFSGNLLSVLPKERLVVKSGMQVKGRTVADSDLLEFGARVAEAFRLFPRGNIQVIRAVDDGLVLIEINPKFPASLPLSVAAGVNAPLCLLRLVLGQTVEPMLGMFKGGLTMMRFWREVYCTSEPEEAAGGL